jgi:hypothetical protein
MSAALMYFSNRQRLKDKVLLPPCPPCMCDMYISISNNRYRPQTWNQSGDPEGVNIYRCLQSYLSGRSPIHGHTQVQLVIIIIQICICRSIPFGAFSDDFIKRLKSKLSLCPIAQRNNPIPDRVCGSRKTLESNTNHNSKVCFSAFYYP